MSPIEADIRERILQCDVAALDDHGVADNVISMLAAEHAARCVTLGRMVEPTLGRALLLTFAGAMLGAIKQIDAATVQEPEIVHVG